MTELPRPAHHAARAAPHVQHGVRVHHQLMEERVHGIAEIGSWADPRARGRGVATDAVRAVCRWAFATLDLEIIEWGCEIVNTASRRVAGWHATIRNPDTSGLVSLRVEITDESGTTLTQTITRAYAVG
ncbi:N-acetyltransferase [Nonomuraea diastatica]|uniref:N-acetyltransferase n=2 Tax=Nonomuraea diastatica TaxID=1848329 RepID=A0A4R4W7I5_9ACTN|nr:N-acetyltransferase [Nonomuraea diastatica]